MRRLTLYILTQIGASLAVVALLLLGLVWLLQIMRLGHHLVVGSPEPGLLGRLLLFSLPTLLTFTLPLALAGAVLYTLGQMAENHELDAMRGFGLSPLQLAQPALLVGIVTAGVALAAIHVEGPALRALQNTVTGAVTRSLVHGLRSGQFHQLPGDTVLYAQRLREGGSMDRVSVDGLMLARGGGQVLTARNATLQAITGPTPGLSLQLTHGELHLADDHGRLTRVQFGRLDQTLEVGEALKRHFGFLGALQRTTAAGAPVTTLALGLLAVVIGLGIQRRTMMVTVGLGAALTVQLGCWVAGGLVLPLVVGAFCLGWLVWSSRAE